MARGHRMVLFDSHNDYANLENFPNLFRDLDADGRLTALSRPDAHAALVERTIQGLNPAPTAPQGRDLATCVYERPIRAASVVMNNTPGRHFLIAEGQTEPRARLSPELVDALCATEPWAALLRTPRVAHYRCFPQLRYYGPTFDDFTIVLLQAFQGEQFSSAQWRCLRRHVGQADMGIDYLRNLYRAVRNDQRPQRETKGALLGMIEGIQAVYRDAAATGATPLDLATFFQHVAERSRDGNELPRTLPQTVYRLSLSDLSSNLRKATVYGVVNFFFRSFKFGGSRARRTAAGAANAYPTLFVLESVRELLKRHNETAVSVSSSPAPAGAASYGSCSPGSWPRSTPAPARSPWPAAASGPARRTSAPPPTAAAA